MFKVARLSKIKELISLNGEVNVLELSNLLGVSSVTIRSDLEELEQSGLLQRTHGGAILNQKASEHFIDTAASHTRDLGPNVKEKKQISIIASHLVKDTDRIFLGPGTTCYYVAEKLLNHNDLHIITNNLYVSSLLSHNSTVNSYLTGGKIDCNGQFTFGEMFERVLTGIYFTKAFLSVDGVDLNGGYTVSNMNLLNIYRKIKEISREIIIVADYSKFDCYSFIKMCGIDEISTVITNEKIPDSYKKYYFTNNIKIFTSYDLENSFSV